MIYSFIGIPLLLIVLADLGKIFTKWIKFVLLYLRRLYYDRSLRGVRRATRSARIQAKVMDMLTRMQPQPPFYVDSITGRLTMWPTPITPTTTNVDPTCRQQSFNKHKSTFIPITPSPPETPMPMMINFEEIDEEFNLPVSLALTILMLYLLLGAIVFWSSEQWTLLHAFYFVFISMSTIGFGDFVPSRVNVLLYAFIYLLFGLALTSMCINVIQEKLASTFERARLTIGESIGLDTSTTPVVTIIDEHDGKKGGEEDDKDEKGNKNKNKSMKKNKKKILSTRNKKSNNNNNNQALIK